MAVRIRTKKASPGQAYLKILAYGPTGSGKSILMLNFLEWVKRRLAAEKKVFVFDTEHSNDFYSKAVPQRSFHPEAYDFDTPEEPTRSLIVLRDFLRDLEPTDPYEAVGVDSLTHFWDQAFDLYTGKLTKIDTIPIHGWNKIKTPWKKMMEHALMGRFHLFLSAREQNVFDKSEAGEFESKGTRAQAEKNTGYEPNLTLRMYQERDDKSQTFRILSFVEKDRSGIWSGKTIDWTSRDRETMEKKVDQFFTPIYQLLVPPDQQVTIRDSETEAAEGVETLEFEERAKRDYGIRLFEEIRDGMRSAKNMDDLKVAWDKRTGHKKDLGDEMYNELETIKDARKMEISAERVAATI